ncbi:glycosyltransferase family 2 protein [Alphaproteobacteria bacterium]|nr:glycosyltransferase family 2 protein [Alphaproteobacteria bacterium]
MKKDEIPPDISVVVPVYNEQDNIGLFLKRTVPVLEKIGTYEIIFCLDPSTDRTEEVILQAAEKNPRVRYILFSRRIGQPSAVLGGILNCQGDSCVPIDVDLQDPPELIADLYAEYSKGNDVVLAQRRIREGETLVKKFVSYLGYKVINVIAEVEIPRNTGDFRIMSRRVVEELRRLSESHGFLRGLIALVGFKQGIVKYNRDARAFGEGNYNRYFGSLKIGFNGLIGFSSSLLSLTLLAGVLIAGVSMLAAIGIIISKLFFDKGYPMGAPTIIILILFMGGVQLISIGVLGEYIGRIYDEVKKRPRFVIDRASEALKIRDYGNRN